MLLALPKGVARLINAFFFSMSGIRACFREPAFRQEIFLSVFLVPFSFWLSDSAVERALLIGSLVFVLMMEIINTAIERAIDRISFERHELSKEAKDMGSAAVFLSLVFAGVVWVMIGVPKFL
jgi:diacylglycerol kinase (ATP)